jgi:hypothetical protein
VPRRRSARGGPDNYFCGTSSLGGTNGRGVFPHCVRRHSFQVLHHQRDHCRYHDGAARECGWSHTTRAWSTGRRQLYGVTAQGGTDGTDIFAIRRTADVHCAASFTGADGAPGGRTAGGSSGKPAARRRAASIRGATTRSTIFGSTGLVPVWRLYSFDGKNGHAFERCWRRRRRLRRRATGRHCITARSATALAGDTVTGNTRCGQKRTTVAAAQRVYGAAAVRRSRPARRRAT